jgi:hypothetical protein
MQKQFARARTFRELACDPLPSRPSPLGFHDDACRETASTPP